MRIKPEQKARSVQSTEALTVRRKMLCTTITCLGSSQAVGMLAAGVRAGGHSHKHLRVAPIALLPGKKMSHPELSKTVQAGGFAFP